MTRIISVYVIFAFLLTSFAGCGKLKNSPVSGLNQSDASASSEVNSQPETPAPPKANNQPEASSEEEWANRNGKAMDVAAVALVGIVFTASAIYHTPGLFNRAVYVPDRTYYTFDPAYDASYLPDFGDLFLATVYHTIMPQVFNNPPNSIEVRGSIIRTAGDV